MKKGELPITCPICAAPATAGVRSARRGVAFTVLCSNLACHDVLLDRMRAHRESRGKHAMCLVCFEEPQAGGLCRLHYQRKYLATKRAQARQLEAQKAAVCPACGRAECHC